MEVLVRLALEKFKFIPPHKAAKLLLEESFQSCFGQLNSHTWRVQKYWTEQVDSVIKQNLKLI
jgi:hypothetical protein